MTTIPKANATPADTARVVAATLKELQAAVPPDEGATTRITRMALEGLASRAGIDVTWREGEPYFSESHTNPLALNAKEQTLERRLRGLEAENQQLRDKLRRSNFNQTRSDVIDSPNRIQVLEEQVEHLKKIKAEQDELAAKESLRKNGASDADLDAVKKLLGKVPKEGEAVQLYDAVIAPESMQTMTMIYAKLKAMDRQTDAISGLNDLLAGAPPSVMASGSAIKRLIDRVKL